MPLLLAAAAAFAAPCVGAAEPSLSLAEALKIAVTRSQQLVSQRAMAEAGREMVVPAGELPDPKLKVGVENVPTDGPDAWRLNRDFMTMSKIGLMQEFPGAEKRRLRIERAERDAERSTAAVLASTLTVEREAASAWFARRFAQEAERAIAAQIGEAELNATAVAAAYRANKASQGELIAAQSVVVELRNRATEAAAQAKRARIVLARYIGPAAERPPGDAPDFSRLPDAANLADVDAHAELDSRERRNRSPRPRPRSLALQGVRLERPRLVRSSRIAVFQHGLAHVLDRSPLVGRHATGSHACGQVAGARCGARDARGCAADAQRGS